MRRIARALCAVAISLTVLHARAAAAEEPLVPVGPISLVQHGASSDPSGPPMHRRPVLVVAGGVLVFSATFLSFWGVGTLLFDSHYDSPIECGSDLAVGVLGQAYGRAGGTCGLEVDTEKRDMGIGLLVGAGASLALGVPLIVLGAKEVPDDREEPANLGRLSIGARPLPGGAGVGIFGSF